MYKPLNISANNLGDSHFDENPLEIDGFLVKTNFLDYFRISLLKHLYYPPKNDR